MRRPVAGSLDHYRVDEVLVEVVHIFDRPLLKRAGQRDVVEHGQMLHQLAREASS